MKNTRTAGWAAIGFVAAVVALNVVENIGAGRPEPGTAAEEVARWATDATPYLWASTLLVPVAWVLLVLVTVTMWERARATAKSLYYPMIAVLGSAMTMGTLSAAIAADAVLISSIDVLSADAVEVLSVATSAAACELASASPGRVCVWSVRCSQQRLWAACSQDSCSVSPASRSGSSSCWSPASYSSEPTEENRRS